jgi:hypothetical protein
MFIDITTVTRVSVEFPTGTTMWFKDQTALDLFIEISRAHHSVLVDYPDRMVSCCASLRDSTQHLSEYWGANKQGEPMKKLGLLEAKHIVEEGIDW